MIQNIAVKKTKRKGKGVFALRDFRKREFILRYKRGKLVHVKDTPKLSRNDQMHLNEIDRDTVEIMRPPEKFINHSCDPNAINKNGLLFALKPIKRGEEITTDYRANGIFKNKWRCHCGSRDCRGYVISDFFTLPSKWQKLYLPYTLKIIQEEYRKRHSVKK